MKAGNMTHILQIKAPKGNKSTSGSHTGMWEITENQVYAERVGMSGGRGQKLGEMFASERVTWNIWDCYAVKRGWRVIDGNEEYTVISIIPDEPKHMLTLVTDRVNL